MLEVAGELLRRHRGTPQLQVRLHAGSGVMAECSATVHIWGLPGVKIVGWAGTSDVRHT